MTTMHDGYAVILEELDELWDVIKQWHGSLWRSLSTQLERDTWDEQQYIKMRKEAAQIAAMALRFMVDLT